MIGVEFDTPQHAEEVQWAAFQRGLLVLECGKSSVRMSPALTVSHAEMATALRLFAEIRGRGGRRAGGPADPPRRRGGPCDHRRRGSRLGLSPSAASVSVPPAGAALLFERWTTRATIATAKVAISQAGNRTSGYVRPSARSTE